MSVTVVTFLWGGGWNPNYGDPRAELAVRALRAQFETYLTIPHRFVCVTDRKRIEGVETFPIWSIMSDIEWSTNSFLRLRLYSSWAREHFGERVLLADLDILLRGNIDDLVTDDDVRLVLSEDFSLWGIPHYLGALQLIRPGAQPHLWDDFDPRTIAEELEREKGKRHYLVGSDQAVLTLRARKPALYTKADGITLWRPFTSMTPDDCGRVTLFCGAAKPWTVPEFSEEFAGWITGL